MLYEDGKRKGSVPASTVDMHRVRVRNRASGGSDVAVRQSGPHLCMRIDATAIRRRDRTRQPVTTPQLVTPLESVKQTSCNGDFGYRRVSPAPRIASSRCARFLWSADFCSVAAVNNGQRFLLSDFIKPSLQDDGWLVNGCTTPTAFYGWCIRCTHRSICF
ncbi:hypothetical protein EVAR_64233_1 [Eumeta japonica]|uniref:Uncharacterized protein n=1 Tax=Eumeta variegata TaxID=151549 RepID=A0A4C1SSV2_EUMVA|nr:hypothetical protein EVAR_64233_1 [Eumeta japonica]